VLRGIRPTQEGSWFARWQDAAGRRRESRTTARTKKDAERLARDLEAKGERQRLGLDPVLPTDGGGTVGSLLGWWLKTYSAGTPSHHTNVTTIRKHLLGAPIAELTLAALRPHHIEQFLQSKAGTLSPQTVNHLRGYLSRAFARAREAGRWTGANPAGDVRRRKVPVPAFDYLRRAEVPAVRPSWRPGGSRSSPLPSTRGAREGELCGLRKTDVDLAHEEREGPHRPDPFRATTLPPRSPRLLLLGPSFPAARRPDEEQGHGLLGRVAPGARPRRHRDGLPPRPSGGGERFRRP
jgi:hypothetical protein